jgi:hypothetical protein
MKIKVCQMWSRLATMLFVMFCLSTAAFAQKTVTGTVLDELGEPLPGVNVVVKGTTNGATTDLDGNFSIRVASGTTLEVSCIGYASQTVAVGNRADEPVEPLVDESPHGVGALRHALALALLFPLARLGGKRRFGHLPALDRTTR